MRKQVDLHAKHLEVKIHLADVSAVLEPRTKGQIYVRLVSKWNTIYTGHLEGKEDLCLSPWL